MRNRLTKQAWIKHGFEVLKSIGHSGLKAERMVKSLKVSRGSFYWHFRSIGDFHAALLEAWRIEITEAVINELKRIPSGQGQLTELIKQVLIRPQELEAAMRSWAQEDKGVAVAILQVDELRIDYIAKVIAAQGIDETTARTRAIILSWSYIGRALAPNLIVKIDQSSAPNIIADIAAMFLAPVSKLTKKAARKLP